MPFDASADAALVLEDAGQRVTLGAATSFGLVQREPLTVVDDAGVTVERWRLTLTLVDGSLAGLVPEALVTVGDPAVESTTTYRVRSVGPANRAGLVVAHLAST